MHVFLALQFAIPKWGNFLKPEADHFVKWCLYYFYTGHTIFRCQNVCNVELVEANVTMSSLREEMVLERFCETASFLTETLHYKSATFTFLLFIGCPLNGRLISPALFFGPSDIITSLLFTCFISHTCLKMPSFSATRSLKKKKKK